ncbi:copper resistance CopC/CopD family protein [Pseudochelatococcus lubricantis]|uniref:copper resistance CopC/CopD family protein n=1 Tax=Pseudochelatococcus lubricantis TaxID=1538102 RepID=UPI0035EFF1FF
MNGNGRTGAAGRRLMLLVLSVLCIAGAQLASMGHARAHASLVRVEPADGAVMAEAPKAFRLTFSEPTSPLVLKLIRPDGTGAVLDRFTLRDATLDIDAPADLGHGTYVLSWRIVSEDGHPVGGSAVFSIGAPGTSAAPVPGDAADWQVRAAVWAAKVALYVGLFIGIGGVFFGRWIGDGTHRVALWSVFAGLAAVPLSVGFQGLDALGVPLADLASPVVWATGFSTSYGKTAFVALAALVLAAMAGVDRGAAGKGLSVTALVVAGLALAASGHASAAHPQWLTRPAVFLHAVGIAFWAGALVPLGAALASPMQGEGSAALRRFSRAIPVAVLPLVVAGALLAAVQLRTPEALWTTAYGKVLLIKLGLLAALFLLAAVNRFRLTTPAAHGDGRATARLRRSIYAELALVLAIFAVAALWRFTPPPRALAEAAAAPASVHLHADKAMADVAIAPGRAGPVRASIAVMTGDFGPLDPAGVTLVLSNPAAGIEQIRRPATRDSEGVWQVEGLNLPVAGQWTVRVDILISDFELVKVEDNIAIRP